MKTRLILLGGFLGAGKTTAIIRLVKWLQARKLRVAVITNDQSGDLVDTALVRAVTRTVREIAGGCFCCRSDVLAETILSLRHEDRPHVIIGEPVGSCTDIRATVIKPLESVYNAGIDIGPFSVVLDPYIGMKIVGNTTKSHYSPQIDYIISKQMEEADRIIVNKSDLLLRPQLSRLRSQLKARFSADVHAVSARTGDGCAEWFRWLFKETSYAKPSIDVDYREYAKGEALLGWLNGAGTVTAQLNSEFEAASVMKRFADGVRKKLSHENAVIAHFKAALTPALSGSTRKMSKQTVSCTVQIGGPGAPTTIQDSQPKRLTSARFVFNLRAEAKPECLRRVLTSVVADVSKLAIIDVERLESFSPRAPQPVHRIG